MFKTFWYFIAMIICLILSLNCVVALGIMATTTHLTIGMILMSAGITSVAFLPITVAKFHEHEQRGD